MGSSPIGLLKDGGGDTRIMGDAQATLPRVRAWCRLRVETAWLLS